MTTDLHCHTTASDGTLTPGQLLNVAVANGVETLAITDHDTIAAYADPGIAASKDLRLIPGIELSTQWRSIGIHVVGLNIDLRNAMLLNGIRRQQAAREERAAEIARRLGKHGVPDALDGARRIARGGQIGRPDFAQHLVDIGTVDTVAGAFKKFLGPGKPGDVKRFWPPMQQVIDWITDAGGIAVLAHPAKYKLTNTKLTALATEFRAAGGHALEVASGPQNPDVTDRLARLCNALELHASCGSDFHGPHQPWTDLGKFPPLPLACRPVWELW